MTDRRFVLNTGAEIPALGLGERAAQTRIPSKLTYFSGTWQSKPGEVSKAVKCAIEAGYRHIDAAYCYGNEDEVGEGLKEAFASTKVKRSDIFVTTKLWCTYHTKVEEGLDKSLKNLGLEYVDLFLMHWPVAMNPTGARAPRNTLCRQAPLYPGCLAAREMRRATCNKANVAFL